MGFQTYKPNASKVKTSGAFSYRFEPINTMKGAFYMLMSKIYGVSTKEEIRAKVEDLCTEYSFGRRNGKELFATYKDENGNEEFYLDEETKEKIPLETVIEKLVSEYSDKAKDECYKALIESKNPMVEACTQMTYEVIKTQDKSEKGIFMRREVVNRNANIDLLDLHRRAAKEGGIGVNPHWVYMIEKLNFLMAVKVGQSVADKKWGKKEVLETLKRYKMQEQSREFQFSANPLSNTQILKTLTNIVQAMIGEEFKPITHDLNFLKEVYSKGKSDNTLQLPNHKTFALRLMKICNNCITHSGYEANTNLIKKNNG